MKDRWEFVKDFYGKKGIFTCDCCEDDRKIDIEVVHILAPPASEKKIRKLEKWAKRPLPPSYKKFLQFANGGVFYTQNTEGEYESGFTLLSAEHVPNGHTLVLNDLKNMISTFTNDPQDEQVILSYLKSIIVIGEELCSDNYIAIDFNRMANNEEYPIIFIGHEMAFAFSELDDKESVLAETLDELLYKAAQDPAYFLMEILGGVTCYSDGKTDIQWDPCKYKTV